MGLQAARPVKTRPDRRVLVVVALFAVICATAIYGAPAGWVGRHETAAVVGSLALYVLTGALVGRWWAPALAFWPVLLSLPLGTQGDSDGVEVWKWALLDTILIYVWAMLAGVLGGWGLRQAQAWRRRSYRSAGQ